MGFVMNVNKTSSLFDRLLLVLTDETRIDSPVQLGEVVHYISSRTGRKATTTPSRMYAIKSLLPGLRKRFIGRTCESVVNEKQRHAVAVSEILEDNERCREFNKLYRGKTSWSLSDGFVREIVGEAANLLTQCLEGESGHSIISMLTLSSLLRTGPGASSKVPGNAGTYARLCDSALTGASHIVLSLYKTCAKMTRVGWAAEAVRQSLHGESDANAFAIFLSVPKTNLKNRGICTQPSANMALQLAIHGLLVRVLRESFGIDLKVQQSRNRHLAKLGSKQVWHGEKRSWKFATLDMSRASNFPMAFVRMLLPKSFYRFLCLIRSPFIEIEGQRVRKHMFSTMGNGFTFSLMTLLFSAIVKALYVAAGLPEFDLDPITGKKIQTWAVYGDDIIVDVSVFQALTKVLESLGNIVNRNKSFSEGPFRESCGGDYYDGYPVRPVFLETLETDADIFSLCNRLMSWSAMHSVDIPRSIQLLTDALSGELYAVPNWEDVCAGLHTPYSFADHHPTAPHIAFKGLDGTAYKKLEARAKHSTVFCEVNKSSAQRWLAFDQGKYVLHTGRKNVTSSVDWRAQNLPGILLGMLEGSVRIGKYGVRPKGDVRYKCVWDYAPSWGSAHVTSGTATGLRSAAAMAAHSHWEMQVLFNTSLISRLKTSDGRRRKSVHTGDIAMLVHT